MPSQGAADRVKKKENRLRRNWKGARKNKATSTQKGERESETSGTGLGEHQSRRSERVASKGWLDGKRVCKCRHGASKR